jgi:hypothetical protein
MKKVFLLLIIFKSLLSHSQNDSTLIIDNVNARVSLPFWLKAGQSIDLGTNTKLVSIIEFTISNNNLIFSQAISLTTAQTVPANKVWKIEGIGVTTQNSFIPSSNGLSSSGSSSSSTSNLPTIFQSPKKFETPGTYSWTVPPSVTSICIEAWGGGGNGGRCTNSSYLLGGGGGGGGGYGYQCFTVVPGTSYNVVVGNSGGTSSVGALINATGGGSGGDNGGPGGSGGTSSATFNISGTSGGAGAYLYGGYGGNSNDGYGAPSTGAYGYGASGSVPGGGAGGNSNFNPGGGPGAIGKVIIYW